MFHSNVDRKRVQASLCHVGRSRLRVNRDRPQNSGTLGRDSKLNPPKYEAEAVSSSPLRSGGVQAYKLIHCAVPPSLSHACCTTANTEAAYLIGYTIAVIEDPAPACT
jgi:hypothetical protein